MLYSFTLTSIYFNYTKSTNIKEFISPVAAEKLYEMIERTRTEREMQVCSFCPCSTMDQLSL